MSDKGITGGPLTSLKWGSLSMAPSGEPEIEFTGKDFEGKIAGDESTYSEYTPKRGKLATDVVMNLEDYKKLCDMKDGKTRAGTASTANGDVIQLDVMIDGEIPLSNGVVSLTLSGKVRKQ